MRIYDKVRESPRGGKEKKRRMVKEKWRSAGVKRGSAIDEPEREDGKLTNHLFFQKKKKKRGEGEILLVRTGKKRDTRPRSQNLTSPRPHGKRATKKIQKYEGTANGGEARRKASIVAKQRPKLDPKPSRRGGQSVYALRRVSKNWQTRIELSPSCWGKIAPSWSARASVGSTGHDAACTTFRVPKVQAESNNVKSGI